MRETNCIHEATRHLEACEHPVNFQGKLKTQAASDDYRLGEASAARLPYSAISQRCKA